MAHDEEFVAFAAARGPALRRTAYLLCGDWHAAEDLVQDTLARLYVRWGRLSRRDALDPYARKVLLRLYLDRNRLARSSEVPTAEPGGGAAEADRSDDRPEDRLDLMRALDRLPPRQRLVLVLRFWDDLAVSTVADLMQVPEGTVKSLTARGLDALRAELARHGTLIDVRGDE